MPFTVADFGDLVRLLEQQPEWHAELRRLVLTDEVLALPQAVQSLTEAQRRTEEQLAILAQRVDGLAEQMAALARRVDTLTQDVQLMVKGMDSLGRDVGDLKGIGLEFRYWRHALAYFQSIARRIYPLSARELSLLLDQAMEEGKLSRPDMSEILQTDLVLEGQCWEDRTDVYLVVEVSWGVGPGDVERAAQRSN
jgi:hypothetical protein